VNQVNINQLGVVRVTKALLPEIRRTKGFSITHIFCCKCILSETVFISTGKRAIMFDSVALCDSYRKKHNVVVCYIFVFR